MALYIRQNRICFGVSLRSISKHPLDFLLKFLELRPSKIKFTAEISLKNIIKSIFFVKKKQDFSAAKTPHSNLEVNVFYKDTSPLDNILKKKEIKNAPTN